MSELTTEEFKDILVIVGRLYTLLWKMNDVLTLCTSDEVLNKMLTTTSRRKAISSISLLFQISQGKLDQKGIYTPKEMNKRIAENLIQSSMTDPNDMISWDQAHQHEKFISSKEFRELLKQFERFGLLDHISGKQAVKKFTNKKPEISGRPEFYRLSEDVYRLEILLSKPHVVDMIIEALEKSDLLSNYFGNVLMTSVLMFRNWDEKHIHKLLKTINPEKVPDLETFVKSMKPKREILSATEPEKIKSVVKPLIKEWVSSILSADNIMIRTLILLSISNFVVSFH
jgi:hypothetical protein